MLFLSSYRILLQRCGRGLTFDDGGAVCIPIDEECPVTGVLVAPLTKSLAPTLNWEAVGTFPEGTHVLYIRREQIDELPLVDLSTQLTNYAYQDYTNGEGYRSDENSRGPCYIDRIQGVRQTLTKSNSKIDPSDSILWDYRFSFPGTCKKVDSRYILFDRLSLASVLLDNAPYSVPECAQFAPIYMVDNPAYNSATDPDYVNNGVACESTATAGTCVRDGTDPDPQFCSVGDSICDQVLNQNVCGQYVQAMRVVAADNDGNSFGMYRRSEIFWLDSCEVTKDDIYGTADMLKAAVGAQLAGVILSYVFGLTLGFFYPLVYRLMRGNPPIPIISNTEVFVHLIKMAPLIATISFIGRVSLLNEITVPFVFFWNGFSNKFVALFYCLFSPLQRCTRLVTCISLLVTLPAQTLSPTPRSITWEPFFREFTTPPSPILYLKLR
jgi:hypothetical protein